MKDLTFRLAEQADVRPLAKLHVAAWKVAYAPILPQEHLDWVSVEREVRRKRTKLKDGTPILVAEEDGESLGFMVYSPSGEKETGLRKCIDIDSFWVQHDLTRQGIGTALLSAMIQREKPENIHVWVLTGVKAGPSFYEKHGFQPDEATRQDFIFLDETLPMVQYCKKCKRRIRRKK